MLRIFWKVFLMDMLPGDIDAVFLAVWQEYARDEFKIGRLLLHGKELLSRGDFSKWLSGFKFSRQTAYRYMRLAQAEMDRLVNEPFPEVPGP